MAEINLGTIHTNQGFFQEGAGGAFTRPLGSGFPPLLDILFHLSMVKF